jgi:hypothetical protein
MRWIAGVLISLPGFQPRENPTGNGLSAESKISSSVFEIASFDTWISRVSFLDLVAKRVDFISSGWLLLSSCESLSNVLDLSEE